MWETYFRFRVRRWVNSTTMSDVALKGPNGHEYKVSTWPIESEIRLSNWKSTNCVLVVTKEELDQGGIKITSIWDIRSIEVGVHFRSWNAMEADGRPMHIDRQLGATHYGVIHCDDAKHADHLASELMKVNSTLFNELLGLTVG